MKRLSLKYIAVAGICCSLLFSSCMKDLNTKPQTFQTNINSLSDLQAAMAGAYNGLKSDKYYDSHYCTAMAWSGLPDIMGDDFIEAFESYGNWRPDAEWRYASDDAVTNDAFTQAYLVIGSANDVIQNCAGYESGASIATAFQLEAQARALRAHCHFDLMRYYAESYQRNSDSLGVPYVTAFSTNNPLDARPSRISVKNCYDSIYNDLNIALRYYRQYGDVQNPNRFLIDSMTIHAMLARIGLYNGQYAQSISDASIVINNLPLADINTYPQIWVDSTMQEIVWQVPNDQTMRPGFADNGLVASYRVASNFRDLVFGPAGGIRSDPHIIQQGINGIGNVSRTLLFKYDGAKNFKVYRSSEMYLIRAECEYDLSLSGSLDDLNTLRTTRGAPAGLESGSSLFDAIFTERRLELIGEGHRWFDIRRTTRTIARDECGSSGQSFSTICSVGPDSRSWIWPIPYNEINLNSNLKQNPGY